LGIISQAKNKTIARVSSFHNHTTATTIGHGIAQNIKRMEKIRICLFVLFFFHLHKNESYKKDSGVLCIAIVLALELFKGKISFPETLPKKESIHGESNEGT